MRDRVGVVHGAGLTMRALVDDILDVAKMETGNLTVEAAPMDLCAVLGEVTRLWEEQARAKGLRFALDLSRAPRWIVGDSARLRQIVFNLLSNAIKFTAEGGITLAVDQHGEEAARRLRLVVQDSGIGIPAAKFDEIFESFRQVDAGTTRQFGGTGLGLTICRNLARALGGDIAVESTEGQGSAFAVDLPLVLAEAPAGASGGEAPAGPALLVLERNPIARSMLRTLLEPHVASFRFAATPGEALDMLAGACPTCLLADEATLKAAADDPLPALGALARANPGGSTAVLWMPPDPQMRSQLHAAGIGYIIEKPIAGAALVAAVVPVLKQLAPPPSDEPLVSVAA
jgi:CheY-like chemotaxis protein/anti-sigma regulatory factor (Ser/Thr protein kinase)